MQILFLHKLNSYWIRQLQVLKNEFPGAIFIYDAKKEDRISLLKTADAVVGYKLTHEEINNAANLKAVFVPFTGLDNFPVGELIKKNAIITNTHANAKYVAERAVSLSLTLLGRVIEFHNKFRKGFWQLDLEPENYWNTIQGKTCAILGYGHIGQYIAKFLKGFDCKIIAFKKNLNEKPPFADEITNDLIYSIKNSEIIFLTLPLTPETNEIISKDIIMLMKGKYLINVGRGGLVNEEGLYLALKNKILAGAAIDVWYNYPSRSHPEPVFPSNFPIYELDNVVLSPHKSGFTKESIHAMIDDTVNSIRTYLKTGTPTNIVKDYY